MPFIEFPYTLHKGYLMPIIPITILAHKVWVFVDSGATFTILSIDDARRLGIDWEKGRPQMISVHGKWLLPSVFLSVLGSVSTFWDAPVSLTNFRSALMIVLAR